MLFIPEGSRSPDYLLQESVLLKMGVDPDQLVPEVSSSCLTPFYLDNESTLIIQLHHGFQIGKSFSVSYQSKT